MGTQKEPGCKKFLLFKGEGSNFCINVDLFRLIYRVKYAINFLDKNEASLGNGPRKFRSFPGKDSNFSIKLELLRLIYSLKYAINNLIKVRPH